jgi:pyruvate kinase
MMVRVIVETEPLAVEQPGPSRGEEGNALAHAAVKLAEDLNAGAIIAPTLTGVSAQRLSAFRPRRPILAYCRRPETTRRLHLMWGVTATDLMVPVGVDPMAATLDRARQDLPPGTRVVVLDIAPAGLRGIPSLVNAITL